MRLDKYLKVSRLIKRRTVANEACDAGRVMVNSRVAKASQDVKVGDIIEIAFGNKSVRAEVLVCDRYFPKGRSKGNVSLFISRNRSHIFIEPPIYWKQ